MKSWKTTLAGVAGVVAAIATAVQAQFDGDPATIPDWALVAGLLATGVGLLLARDNDKTSERVGARRR
jgi:uncharacterized YccA/Bax inhibitor family protein